MSASTRTRTLLLAGGLLGAAAALPLPAERALPPAMPPGWPIGAGVRRAGKTPGPEQVAAEAKRARRRARNLAHRP